MKISINYESAKALRMLTKQSCLALDDLNTSSKKLTQLFDISAPDLGVFSSDIEIMLNTVDDAQGKAYEVLSILIPKLLKVADKIEAQLAQHSKTFGNYEEASFQEQKIETLDMDDVDCSAFNDANSSYDSEEYRIISDTLKAKKVSYLGIRKNETERSVPEIIGHLGGEDKTGGSCSSLAFAYAGNRAGYDVLDFRGGDSRAFFSLNSSIQQIATLPGVESEIVNGKNDFQCSNDLLSRMLPEKEYYFATGQHAAIVRKTDIGFEYLELQHLRWNGWQPLDDEVLKERFHCKQHIMLKYPNFLIDVESLGKSSEFLRILGYINTAEHAQLKG